MKSTESKTTTTAQPAQKQEQAKQPFFQKGEWESVFSEEKNQPGAFFIPHTIQPKLRVGKPNDPYEQEADAMADKVVQHLPASQQTPFGNTIAPPQAEVTENSNSKGHAGTLQARPAGPPEQQERLQRKESEEEPRETDLGVQRKAIFESNEDVGGADVQMKSLDTPAVQAKCATCEQEEELQKKEASQAEEEPDLQAKAEASAPAPDLSGRLSATKGSGAPLPDDTRGQMESAFGADFSSVRVHTGSDAVQMSQDIHAQAFTHGSDVYFGAGKYDTGSMEGKKLLAHELAHTVQQSRSSKSDQIHLKLIPLKDQLEEELKQWSQQTKKSIDPQNIDYAFNLQEYAWKLIDDPSKAGPLKKPKGKKEFEKWKIKFQKAQLLAEKILSSGDNVEQKEDRAAMILNYMAQAGFQGEAIELSKKMKNPEHIEYTYSGILDNILNASPETLKIISEFYIKKNEIENNPFIQKFTDKSGSEEKKLTHAQITSILTPLINAYENSPFIIDLISEVLIHKPSYRNVFSNLMWKGHKEEFLFKVLESKYFIEPDYGPTVFPEIGELKLDKDMPWVYANKQKYYVGYLVQLGKDTGIQITPPKNLNFLTLRKWLDDKTEKIGEATAKKFPNNPEQLTKIYNQITDIFFYHVSERNINPNLSGRLSKLGPAAPGNMRIQADCDVLATYAMRYFVSIKDTQNPNFKIFEPVGYMVIDPEGYDGHAAALMRRGGQYYVISNKEVYKKNIIENSANEKKMEGIIAMRDQALEVYDPKPSKYKVFYADALQGGAMPRLLAKTENSTRQSNLEP